MQQIKKMGDLKSLLNMIPGAAKMMKDVNIDDRQIARVEAIVQSMTPKERANPDLINLSRKKRIARGCGQSLDSINLFIKNFENMKKMMHQMANSPMQGMMNNAMGGGMPGKMRR